MGRNGDCCAGKGPRRRFDGEIESGFDLEFRGPINDEAWKPVFEA
jgi:hypothetical protein